MSKGLIFKCSDASEQECLQRNLFASDTIAKDQILLLEPGDSLFLLNLDSDELKGVFTAASHGGFNIVRGAWKGRYPYQVQTKSESEVHSVRHAKSVLNALQIEAHQLLEDYEVSALSSMFSSNGNLELPGLGSAEDTLLKRASIQLKTARKERGLTGPAEHLTLESTTLWDYPKQSYGNTPKGNNRYAGVTPAFLIWNLVKRYTNPGDLVVDPMCGSGTTIDVCKEEGRRVIGFDVVPTRPDIRQNDARVIPLGDNSVDMMFIDSPYGDNIKYNDDPRSIGTLSAESEEFYDELEKVMREAFRVLKPGKVLGWLIGDQWVKKRFTPVGFMIYERLTRYFEPIDIVSVTRRNQSSNTGMWHNRARRFNFYLRGFKYLHIVKKPELETQKMEKDRAVQWAYYDRDWKAPESGEKQ